MQIERKGEGPWADVNVEGVLVTISVSGASRVYDCANLQADNQLEIDLVLDEAGNLAEGAANGCEYVASLILPPKRYVEMDLPRTLAEGDTAEDAAGLEPLTESVPVLLPESDMEAVRLVLWTIARALPNFETSNKQEIM